MLNNQLQLNLISTKYPLNKNNKKDIINLSFIVLKCVTFYAFCFRLKHTSASYWPPYFHLAVLSLLWKRLQIPQSELCDPVRTSCPRGVLPARVVQTQRAAPLQRWTMS